MEDWTETVETSVKLAKKSLLLSLFLIACLPAASSTLNCYDSNYLTSLSSVETGNCSLSSTTATSCILLYTLNEEVQENSTGSFKKDAKQPKKWSSPMHHYRAMCEDGEIVCPNTTTTGCQVKTTIVLNTTNPSVRYVREDYMCCCSSENRCNTPNETKIVQKYIDELQQNKTDRCYLEMDKTRPTTCSKSHNGWCFTSTKPKDELGCGCNLKTKAEGSCSTTASYITCCCKGAFCNVEGYMNAHCRSKYKQNLTHGGPHCAVPPTPSNTPVFTPTTNSGQHSDAQKNNDDTTTTATSGSVLLWVAIGVAVVVLLLLIIGVCVIILCWRRKKAKARKDAEEQKSVGSVATETSAVASEQKGDGDLQFKDRIAKYYLPADDSAPIKITNQKKKIYKALTGHRGGEEIDPSLLINIKGRNDLTKPDAADGGDDSLKHFVKLNQDDGGTWVAGGSIGKAYYYIVSSQKDTGMESDAQDFEVVVKKISTKLTEDASGEMKFPDKLHEQLKLAMMMNDQNAARLFGYFPPEHRGEALWLVWERVIGIPVNYWLKLKCDQGKRVPERVRVGIMAQVANFTMACTIRGNSNYNIKPDNIMISEKNDGEVALGVPSPRCHGDLPFVKVTDWAPQMIYEKALQGEHSMLKCYLAPESLADDAKPTGELVFKPESASFALAATFIELMQFETHGRIPEQRVNTASVPSDTYHVPTVHAKGLTGIPEGEEGGEPKDLNECELRRLLLRCMDRDPSVRPLPYEIASYLQNFYISYDQKNTWEGNLRTSRMRLPPIPSSERELKREDVGLPPPVAAPLRVHRQAHKEFDQPLED